MARNPLARGTTVIEMHTAGPTSEGLGQAGATVQSPQTQARAPQYLGSREADRQIFLGPGSLCGGEVGAA